MKTTVRFQLRLIVVLQLVLSATCLAQSGDGQDKGQEDPGHYLLDLSYTDTSSFEGTTDVFSLGFTWLVRPDLRVGATTTYVAFNPNIIPELNLDGGPSNHGLGDSIFFVQYDWEDRLTASPWIPDDLGLSLSVLAPTGNAENFLGADAWGASIAISWPIVIEGGWLLNPGINYNFSFNEGPLAEHVNVGEAGINIVKVFPSKFWISYTPSVWYDFDVNTWNFDSHLTIGKMFSTGMGIGLDYGRLERHSRIRARDDRSLVLNFYFQFGH